MSSFLNTLKSKGRAAAIALALGATSIVGLPATPAMAQSFSFDFGISGGSETFSFGVGRGGRRVERECLRNNEIRRGLRGAGFYDIEIGNSSRNRVRVLARWEGNGNLYSMRVHRCSGRVTDIERVRRGGGGNPGFSLQFSY